MNESDISDITDNHIGRSKENTFMKCNHNHFLTGGNCNERNSLMR